MASFKSLLLALVALALAGLPGIASAQADPAAAQIQRLDAALLGAMKQGPALGMPGRVRLLEPAVDQAFDIPAMTRFAVGPAWTTMSDADHAALIEAFRRLSVASYAHNFDSFSGETFVVDANVETRGPDKLVQCRIVPAHGSPTTIIYRMRETSGAWKVIDVYYNGAISQLTTRRSDFAATIAAGGAKALIAHIDAQTAKLMH